MAIAVPLAARSPNSRVEKLMTVLSVDPVNPAGATQTLYIVHPVEEAVNKI
jgi:hypothetical protein